MCQEQPSISNGRKQVFGITVKQWTMLFIGFIFAILFFFAVLPFAVALILHAIYPDKDFSGIMGLSDGITFIIGFVGTIASAASIIMTILDRKRYVAEQILAEEQRKSVQKIDDNITKMNKVLERFENKNNSLLMELLKRSCTKGTFHSIKVKDYWEAMEHSNEE